MHSFLRPFTERSFKYCLSDHCTVQLLLSILFFTKLQSKVPCRSSSIPSFHTPEAHINIVKLLQSPFLSIKIIFIDRIDKIIAVQQAIYTVSSKCPFVVWTTTIRQSSKKHRSQITSNLTIRDSLANVDFSFQIEDITK